MKDLQLVGGDLFALGRGFATVTGTDYVRQRVATALAEPYGSDPYHPEWGSGLNSYLGGPVTDGVSALIQAEASRVLGQLVAAQQQILRTAALAGTRSQLNAADVIATVDKVSAAPGPQPATVMLSVSLTTRGGPQLAINRTLGS
jgi:hypothetical protein